MLLLCFALRARLSVVYAQLSTTFVTGTKSISGVESGHIVSVPHDIIAATVHTPVTSLPRTSFAQLCAYPVLPRPLTRFAAAHTLLAGIILP